MKTFNLTLTETQLKQLGDGLQALMNSINDTVNVINSQLVSQQETVFPAQMPTVDEVNK